MHHSFTPLGPQHLPALLHLAPTARAMGRLRWYLHTPYATVLGHAPAGTVAAVAGVLHLGGHAHMGLLLGNAQELVPALSAHLRTQGVERITVHAPHTLAPLLERAGLLPVAPLGLYRGGRFIDASLDEVLLLEPPHI